MYALIKSAHTTRGGRVVNMSTLTIVVVLSAWNIVALYAIGTYLFYFDINILKYNNYIVLLTFF